MLKSPNPTVKAAAVLLAALCIAFSFSPKMLTALIVFCVISIIAFGGSAKTILKALIPATLAAAALAVAIYSSGDGSTAIQAGFSAEELASSPRALRALAVGIRIYAYFFLGMCFALTTDNMDFIYSLMQQCSVKPKYAYGVLAAFNLIPQLRDELRQIRLSYRVRGYHPTPLSVKVLFTALVNAVRRSESLAMAMESKGFEDEGERSYARSVSIRSFDLIWSLLLLAIAFCSIFIR